MSDGDLVTLLNTEGRGDVGSQVLVSLLVTRVLGDVVKVLAADDQGAVHLGRDDGSGQDAATDGDKAGERALLVCLGSMVSNDICGLVFCIPGSAQGLLKLLPPSIPRFAVARASSS